MAYALVQRSAALFTSFCSAQRCSVLELNAECQSHMKPFRHQLREKRLRKAAAQHCTCNYWKRGGTRGRRAVTNCWRRALISAALRCAALYSGSVPLAAARSFTSLQVSLMRSTWRARRVVLVRSCSYYFSLLVAPLDSQLAARAHTVRLVCRSTQPQPQPERTAQLLPAANCFRKHSAFREASEQTEQTAPSLSFRYTSAHAMRRCTLLVFRTLFCSFLSLSKNTRSTQYFTLPQHISIMQMLRDAQQCVIIIYFALINYFLFASLLRSHFH